MDPLLVTLALDPESQDLLQTLRDRYFPPERNVVPAHISLFHKLPGEDQAVIAAVLQAETSRLAPFPVELARLHLAGSCLQILIESHGLKVLHAALARQFSAWLTPQDRQGYRPHATVMNKTARPAADAAFAELAAEWQTRSSVGVSLRLWRYRGGPWDAVASFPLGGST